MTFGAAACFGMILNATCNDTRLATREFEVGVKKGVNVSNSIYLWPWGMALSLSHLRLLRFTTGATRALAVSTVITAQIRSLYMWIRWVQTRTVPTGKEPNPELRRSIVRCLFREFEAFFQFFQADLSLTAEFFQKFLDA